MIRAILPMTTGMTAMTEEKLQARKQEAERAREQALNNARHWGGVIADCDYWLEESRKEEGGEQNKPREQVGAVMRRSL
jgi:hypothetical protein